MATIFEAATSAKGTYAADISVEAPSFAPTILAPNTEATSAAAAESAAAATSAAEA